MIDTNKDALYLGIGYCDDRCKNCTYHGTLNGNTVTCDYIGVTGHRRPCPAGPECTYYTDKAVQYDQRGRVAKRIPKPCEMCGKVTYIMTNAKYCAECGDKRTAEKLHEAKVAKRKQKKEKYDDTIKVVSKTARLHLAVSDDMRSCVVCGSSFKPTSQRNIKCPKCRHKKRRKSVTSSK